MRIILRLKITLLVLSVLFFAVPHAKAQPPTDPTDMEGMRAFVEAAKARLTEVGFQDFRKEATAEGRWKQNTTYLILLENGRLSPYPYLRPELGRQGHKFSVRSRRGSGQSGRVYRV